jgi:long-subunit acyl-CoA synthetase (AMP-forming)
MTTTHAGDLQPAIAAERESIEAEIAGGTLLTAFAETAERHGGTEAYRWRQDGEWRTLTYAGLRDQVRDTALGLAAIGVRPGDFAVIWSRNRPEANIADMAVMHARGVPVFLYNTLAPSQAAYIAGHCEATVAIVEDRGFLARLEAVRPQLPQLRRVVLIDGEPGPGEDWLIAWDTVLALGRAEAGRSPGLFEQAIKTGRELARWRQRGEPVPAALHVQTQQTAPVRQALLAFVGLDACRLAASGAAPIDPEVIEFFQALGLPMVEAWGMTELTNAATVSNPDRARNGAVGTACPGVEVRLAGDGEVLVRGPLVMRGYYRELARTADTLDRDGWLHTGDIGTLDADGFLTIVDRKKELIITSGGKNISPVLIESLLQRHPLIGQACAIGDRRNYVTALLVLDGEAAPVWAQQHGIGSGDLAELAAHPQVLAEVAAGVRRANRDLARVEQVRRFTLLPAEWTAETGELTPTLKRRRRVIVERYAADIQRLYGPPGPGVIDVTPEGG